MIEVKLKDSSYNEISFRFHKFANAAGFINIAMNHSVCDVVVTIATVKNSGEPETNVCD